jgi:hypothetical protein
MPFGTIINNSGAFGIINVTAPPPSANPITVPYTELEPEHAASPVVTTEGQGGGTKVTRIFKVNWADAITFQTQALGYSYVTGSGGSTKLRACLESRLSGCSSIG